MFQNLFLTYSPPILGRSDDASKSKETVQKLKFLDSPLLLHGTTDIRAASEKPFCVSLLQIDDADARSLAEIKRRRTCCTLSIYFGVATTQMHRIFAKGDYCFAQATILYFFVAVGGCAAINF